MYTKLIEHLSVPPPNEMEPHGHYCAICDNASITPHGNGGRWFAAYGHRIDNRTGKSDKYEAVRFAVCISCLEDSNG